MEESKPVFLSASSLRDKEDGYGALPEPVAKRGELRAGFYYPPVVPRAGYIHLRQSEANNYDKKGWRPLDPRKFIHMEEVRENFYAPDAALVFDNLYLKLKWDKVKVIRGFDPHPEQGKYSPHTIGIAMDIAVQNIYEALYVADTAWSCGIRAIAIGGKYLDKDRPGFVHVDIGPKAEWYYDHHDVYSGPGTFAIRW